MKKKKTRFEIAKESPEAMANMICDMLQDNEDRFKVDFVCDACPWTDYCGNGKNGIEEWLKEFDDEEDSEEAFD